MQNNQSYAAMLDSDDTNLVRIMEKLDALNITDKTVINLN